MSRSVDLFIACREPLEVVAQTVAKLTKFQVVPGEGESWLVQDGDVHAVLGEHRYPDHAELPLGRYRYALSARVPDTVRPQDSAPAALLRRVAQMLQENCPPWLVLMVLDFQYKDNPTKPGPEVEADRATTADPAANPDPAATPDPAGTAAF